MGGRPEVYSMAYLSVVLQLRTNIRYMAFLSVLEGVGKDQNDVGFRWFLAVRILGFMVAKDYLALSCPTLNPKQLYKP